MSRSAGAELASSKQSSRKVNQDGGAQGPDLLRRSQSLLHPPGEQIIAHITRNQITSGHSVVGLLPQHNPPAKVPLAADILWAHGSLPCIGPPPAEALGLLIHSRLSV